ncbi:hypothetical protein QUF58_11760 [Anaerolineales bacterium HSG24]|nr:hypothetical protein [Anaerolineales bacterium HSG24]
MTQKFLWSTHFPNETLEDGINLANQLYWHIKVSESEGVWQVWAGDGESLILQTDSKEAVDAFLYGLGLAYSVLPESVFEQLKAEVKRWV